MYDKIVRMYEVNNLSHIMDLKNQRKKSKMCKGETIQSFFMQITEIRDQLRTAQEIIPNRELVMTALSGLPSSWDMFITSINNRESIPSFDELLALCNQEERLMISRGRIQRPNEGEFNSFIAQGKKKNVKKGKGKPSKSRRPPQTNQDSKD